MKPWCILRAAATVLLVLAVISSAGCWSRREIQEIGFALLIGLDHAAEEGKVMITVHIAKPFLCWQQVQVLPRRRLTGK